MGVFGEHPDERMKKITLDDLEAYDPPGHFDMTALRVVGQEKDGSEVLWMGRSHFLPGGGAEMDASPTEKIYHVVDGTVQVETPDGETIRLSANDTLYLGPNEERSVVNPTNEPATMLVVGYAD